MTLEQWSGLAFVVTVFGMWLLGYLMGRWSHRPTTYHPVEPDPDLPEPDPSFDGELRELLAGRL
jgi:hypothetical protein